MKQLNSGKYKILADRYANALWQIAEEKNEVEKFGEELKSVSETISQNSDINAFFVNPTISGEDKKEVLKISFENKISKPLYDFLNLLIDKGRIFLLSPINNLYFQKILKKQNILEVEVQSVIPLDEEMKNLLATKLQKILNKNINIKNTIDSDIIGGVVLRFGGKVVNGSVQTQLKKIQKQLI